MCRLLKQAPSILARDTGELATNYQDAVKGVLTVTRPAATGALECADLGNPTGAVSHLLVTSSREDFKKLPTASATIKGFEVMRMIRKRQCLMVEDGAAGEISFVNRLFCLAA